jgi:hypothetical protein
MENKRAPTIPAATNHQTDPTEDSQIPAPIRLLDELCSLTKDKYGNTPRPEKAELLFISAMQSVSMHKWGDAEKKLLQSRTEAKRTGQVEPEAISLMTVGWVFVQQGKKEQALQSYVDALAIWERVHGRESPKLRHLLEDIAAVCTKFGEDEKARQFAQRAAAT